MTEDTVMSMLGERIDFLEKLVAKKDKEINDLEYDLVDQKERADAYKKKFEQERHWRENEQALNNDLNVGNKSGCIRQLQEVITILKTPTLKKVEDDTTYIIGE